jgi:hypothetical protein
MVGEQVIVLSELATVILETIPGKQHVGLDEVVHAVISELGVPEPPLDARSLTNDNIHDLAAHGVLVLDTPPPDGPPTSEAATAAVQAAMSAVLAPAPGSRWSLPAEVSSASFLTAVRRQRVGSQIVTGLGRLDLPGEIRAHLEAESGGMRAACVGLARDLHRVHSVLQDVGIRALWFKGMPLAAQAWGDEAARGYGDLDLLVSQSDVADACLALADEGWQLPVRYPAPGPSWGWRQFIRTNYEMPMTLGTTILDLHWHALPSRSAFPPFDELWARRDTVRVAGRPVPTFSPYDALAHSASHSAKDHWRWLRGLADIHRLAGRADTWLTADRPLRPDQLLSLGIAATILGVPDGAPTIVTEAARRSEAAASRSSHGQLGPEHPSINDEWERARMVSRSYVTLLRTRPRPGELVRHVARSALPIRHLARADSRRAWIAVPQVVGSRAAELADRRRDLRA